MSSKVQQGNHPIDKDTRSLISKRYKRITKAVNEEFWNHLSGILIDTFVYKAIGEWHWPRDDEENSTRTGKCFEESLLDYYNRYPSYFKPTLYAPGSGMIVDSDDWNVLGKILNRMV